jgi:NTP pyrophosphatase (non-canonical NTP hydrolase)
MEAAAYPQRGVTTMKARLKPTHIIDNELLKEALEVADAVGREKDRDLRTALEQEAIRLWNEAHGRELA